MSINATFSTLVSSIAVQSSGLLASATWLGKYLHIDYKDLTSRKAQIIFCKTMAGLSLVAATAVIGITIGGVIAMPAVWAAIPLYLFGGLAFIYSFYITDYDNPQVVSIFRKEAEILSLDALVTKHSWEKMFCYGIPLPKRFNALYREKVKAFSLKEVISFYETVEMERSKGAPFKAFLYTVPHPSEWKAKWRQETGSMPVCDIVDNYSLTALEKHQILPQEELEMLSMLSQRRTDALTEHRQKLTEISDEYQRSIAPALIILQEELAKAEFNFKSIWDPQRLQVIKDRYRRDMERIEAERKINTAQAQRQLQLFEESVRKSEHTVSPQARQEIARRRAAALGKIKEVEESTSKAIERAQERFTETRRGFSMEIRQAEEQKKLCCREAQGTFNRDTASYREERNRRIQEEEALYAEKKETINGVYMSFLERQIAVV